MMAREDSNNDNNKNVAYSTLVVATNPTTVVTYAKQFPYVSRIEVFNGQNFRHWNECVFTLLDVHSVASALTDVKPDESKSKCRSMSITNSLKKKNEMRPCHLKTTSDGNSTFMIGDPMKKGSIGKTIQLLVLLALNCCLFPVVLCQ